MENVLSTLNLETYLSLWLCLISENSPDRKLRALTKNLGGAGRHKCKNGFCKKYDRLKDFLLSVLLSVRFVDVPLLLFVIHMKIYGWDYITAAHYVIQENRCCVYKKVFTSNYCFQKHNILDDWVACFYLLYEKKN